MLGPPITIAGLLLAVAEAEVVLAKNNVPFPA